MPLKLKANFTVRSKLREVDSQNVIAKLEGSDPKLKDEYVKSTRRIGTTWAKTKSFRATRFSMAPSITLRELPLFSN